jgi:putative transcriptional regulator
MARKHKNISLFEQLKSGLEDSIAYSKGELSLNTVEVPDPPPEMTAGQIRVIRNRLRMSQAVFAATINVSARTVQSWEQGKRRPGDAALHMIEVINHQPGVVQAIFAGNASPSRNTPKVSKRRRRAVLQK